MSKFNFNIDVEDNERQNSLSKSKYNSITLKKLIEFNEDVVDLGLPSGTLWCKYNLDVDPNKLSKAKDWYGKYYAWGELEGNKNLGKDSSSKGLFYYFDWDNYKYGDYKHGCGEYWMNKYCNKPDYGLRGFTDNLTELLPEDDAAYQFKKCHNYKFHIPTKEQYEELINYTNNYWVKNYDPNKLVHNPKNDGGIRGLNGRVFEGKKNGNLLFIPAAGFSSNKISYHSKNNIYLAGSYCVSWSSSLTLSQPTCAYYLCTDSRNVSTHYNERYKGLTIRPVINL